MSHAVLYPGEFLPLHRVQETRGLSNPLHHIGVPDEVHEREHAGHDQIDMIGFADDTSFLEDSEDAVVEILTEMEPLLGKGTTRKLTSLKLKCRQ